jgi:hypothetical protein
MHGSELKVINLCMLHSYSSANMQEMHFHITSPPRCQVLLQTAKKRKAKKKGLIDFVQNNTLVHIQDLAILWYMKNLIFHYNPWGKGY